MLETVLTGEATVAIVATNAFPLVGVELMVTEIELVVEVPLALP
jgi:hypothetical protein